MGPKFLETPQIVLHYHRFGPRGCGGAVWRLCVDGGVEADGLAWRIARATATHELVKLLDSPLITPIEVPAPI